MIRDLRHAFRALRHSPSFTTVAVMVLTLGIGATTAIFSVVDAVALRALPYDDADRLVVIASQDKKTGALIMRHTPQDFRDWSTQQELFSSSAAYTAYGVDGFTLLEGGPPQELRGQRVTADFFDVLRARPSVGQAFTKANETEGHHRVLVISDGLWRRRFNASPDVIGRMLTFHEEGWQIVGVMPRGFMYPPSAAEPTDIWIPFTATDDQFHRGARRSYFLQLIARLKDGVSVEQANSRFATINAQLAERYPDWFQDRTPFLRPLHDALIGNARSWMLMLLGAVGFVLIVACINVANLMLARGVARSREVAVRLALGANRWAVARVLLAESVVLSVVGTLAGLAVAAWSMSLLRAALPLPLRDVASIRLDLRVLGMAAFTACLATVVFGLLPALLIARRDAAVALRTRDDHGGTGTRPWMRATFVVAQVALAVPLLVATGLFVVSFIHLLRVDLGLDPRGVHAMSTSVHVHSRDPESVKEARAQANVAIPQIVEKVRALPGIEAAAFTDGGVPLSGDGNRTPIVRIPGRKEPFTGNDGADMRYVTADYAKVLRTPLRLGRYISDADVKGTTPVVVLNEEAVRRYFDGRDPVGTPIQINGERVIVGVVADVYLDGPGTAIRPTAFIPIAQTNALGGALLFRTSSDAPMTAAVQQAIWSVLPGRPIRGPVSLEDLLARTLWLRQFMILIVATLGMLAIVIAAVGVYGVLAYIVAQRTPEIGIRLALGAHPRQVLRMILTTALSFLAIGVGIGLGSAWLLARLVERFLYGVAPRDPLVFATTAIVVLGAGLLAAVAPSWRAARVDPVTALRNE